MRYKRFWLVWICCFWLGMLFAQPKTSCLDRLLTVEPATASLLQWFQWIEREGSLQLSYNSSLLDLNASCPVSEGGTYRVADFLVILLKDFRVGFQESSPGKLLLQIERRGEYTLEGRVTEQESEEKLSDAYVFLTERNTRRVYMALAENGTFRLPVLEGDYVLRVHYMGYVPYEHHLVVPQTRLVSVVMQPLSFELGETTVRPQSPPLELDASLPSNKLTYTNANLFSQMNILPGVIGAPMGVHFQVNGGGDDENLLLVDGVPLYHYGHMNTLMAPFNGDAIKSIAFHRNFFPTQYEGRISSVTDVRMKEGNKQEHVQTFSWDMPAASVMLEGPVWKNRMSYLLSARRSWLDFLDEFVNENLRMNHSYTDYQAKLSFDVTPFTSMQAMSYYSDDEYHVPDDQGKNQTVMRWQNQIYQWGIQSLIGKNFSIESSLAYTSYLNKALIEEVEPGNMHFLQSGIRSVSWTAGLSYQLDPIYHAHWGIRVARETYQMAVFGDTLTNQNEPVTQLSLFYDNRIRINSRLMAQLGVNYVVYAPDHYRNYQSIQPRLSLRYSIGANDLVYAGASRMEQFYHYLAMTTFSMPTDFRMPSIEGFHPRSSEHYEAGWKHFLKKGYWELSAFYKTRRHVAALRPEAFPTDNRWQQYIMSGNGMSYGVKAYLATEWKRLGIQASYAYIRSWEWFSEYAELGKVPSLYDVPHAFAAALTYHCTENSSISIGGEVRSGRVQDLDEDMEAIPEEKFRSFRDPLRYRLDAGYGFQKTFRKFLFAFRVGFYSIVGNPPLEEIQNFYFVNFQQQCLPYVAMSVKL